jgi:drug/metabolite transporter (DMT)-like permease
VFSAAAIALASAVCYGAADFIGGLTSRRAPTLAVVFVSQLAGALVVLAALPLLPPAVVARADLIWGAMAGLAGGTGVALLYRGLAIGTMSLVAPTTAVLAVAIPVAVSTLAFGERPSMLTLAGMLIALIAIVLVGQVPVPTGTTTGAAHTPRNRAALLIAITAGVAIGIFFVALARTSKDAGMWPLLSARAASAVLFAAIGLVAGHGALRLPRAALPMAIVCGLIDMLANALYLIATRGGALSVIVTLASLYPASTVLLARIVLHEKLGWLQVTGVVAALVSIALIVSG